MATKESIDAIIKDINALATPPGALHPVMMRGCDVTDPVRIPTSSYAIDYLLGGGWALGQMHELFGGEHAGKSSLSYMFLQDCQRFDQEDRAIAYIDLEHRFNPTWARQLGIDVDSNSFILAQPPNAEFAIDIMSKLIRSRQICAIVFDSIGAAISGRMQQEFNEKATEMGGTAQVMSRCVNTIAPLANMYDCTIMMINQLRADMAGFHRPTTPGGHAVKHRMSMRIYVRRGKEKYVTKGLDGNGGVEVGYPMVLKLVKSSFGPCPREQWSDFYFYPSHWLDHVGFDTERELQRLGLLTGIVQRGGSWYTYKDIRGQGRDAFFEEIKKAGLMEEIGAVVLETLNKVPDGSKDAVGSFVDPNDPELMRPEALGPELDEDV